MVTTRRNAAAPAAPAEDAASAERSMASPVPPRQRRTGRKATQATAQRDTSGPAQPTSTRRTRSKAAASPLKQLDDTRRNAPKTVGKKATQQTKRKRDTSARASVSASATPEPEATPSEPAQDENEEEQGLFFTHGTHDFCNSPQGQLILPSQGVSIGFAASLPPAPPVAPEAVLPAVSEPTSSAIAELEGLREENLELYSRISKLEWKNQNLVNLNNRLLDQVHSLQQYQPVQVRADTPYSPGFGDITMHDVTPSPMRPEFVRGSESALALLHHVESAARETRNLDNGWLDTESPATQPTQPTQLINTSTAQRDNITATPRSTAGGFFSRSLSAIKSRLGFSARASPSAPSAPSPQPQPTPSRAPPADTLTEALSAPPTPVGERSKAPPKKQRQSPMARLLTKGVEPADKIHAEKWARQIIPILKNDDAFEQKRKRLETPVLIKDLQNFPSSKPWESGFGDPLGDMDDDDVVPVWAVYLDMVAQEEQPKAKKLKSRHGASVGGDDTPSLNDLFTNDNGPQSAPIHDTHGHSASLRDLHPRRSTQPSPMFDSTPTHQKGSNVFQERQNTEISTQLLANERKDLQPTAKATTTKASVPVHDPEHGSFGLDYDSDDDDSTVLSESSTTEATTNATADPVWTQPPPPAPVPAHAPLPGGSAAETSAAPASQQPVDEVERQRQKLMKHTPAKPSRLREAFVPSPSLMSDAGNESMLATTPLPVTGVFHDLPDTEGLQLEFGEHDFAEIDAFKTAPVANAWAEPMMVYESDEEEISSD